MANAYHPFESTDDAAAYKRGNEFRSKLLGDATNRMLDRARLQAGSRVLDIGTGPGATALLAGERLKPGGQVLAIDVSAAMVEQATASVRQSGLENIEVRLMDAATLELPEASIDAIISRNSFQFLPNWPQPLLGFHRVLRPGGWLSFMVWDVRELNPFFSLPATVAIEANLLRLPREALRAAFGLSKAPLEQQLRDAGFEHVSVEQVRSDVLMQDSEAPLAYIRDNPGYRMIAGELTDREQGDYDAAVRAALERFREGDRYRITSVSRVASGSR